MIIYDGMNWSCHSGKHIWGNPDHANLCCNGFFNWLKLPRGLVYTRAISSMHKFLYKYQLGFLCWDFMYWWEWRTKISGDASFNSMFKRSGGSGSSESRQLYTPIGCFNILYETQKLNNASRDYQREQKKIIKPVLVSQLGLESLMAVSKVKSFCWHDADGAVDYTAKRLGVTDEAIIEEAKANVFEAVKALKLPNHGETRDHYKHVRR